jgi:hypothetical protein
LTSEGLAFDGINTTVRDAMTCNSVEGQDPEDGSSSFLIIDGDSIPYYKFTMLIFTLYRMF